MRRQADEPIVVAAQQLAWSACALACCGIDVVAVVVVVVGVVAAGVKINKQER